MEKNELVSSHREASPVASVESGFQALGRPTDAPSSPTPFSPAMYPISSRSNRTNTVVVVGDGGVGVESVESRTEQSSSFFPSSSGFEISGGYFGSSRDHLSTTTGNVIININPIQKSENVENLEIQRLLTPGVNMGSSPKPVHQDFVAKSLEPTQMDEKHETEEQPPLSGRHTSTVFDRSYRTCSPPPLPVQNSSRIYTRHLLTAGLGSPLWIPEPSGTLSMEHQKAGFGIGDVGILKYSGGFDFLFNIYQPHGDAEHPINPQVLPNEFRPLDPPGERFLDTQTQFKGDSFLVSSSEVKSHHDDEASAWIFETSASEGAILTMPNGANSADLQTTKKIRKYVRENAERWYMYANGVHGRDIHNGDLRLIIGKTSATTWGMATIANPSDKRASSSLKFRPTRRTDGGTCSSTSYRWEYSGKAEVKSGPDEREIERLRNFDRIRGEEAQTAYENQCLFIRTINVTLEDDIWDNLAREWADEDEDEDDTSRSESNRDSDSYFSFRSSNSTAGSSVFSPELGHGGRSGGTSHTSRAYKYRGNQECPITTQSVHLSSFPALPLDLHPSTIINNYLLQEAPHADMAITEDRDWISVLRKSDEVFPSPISLLVRIEKSFDICVEEGVVFLQSRKQKPLYLPPEFETNNLGAGIEEFRGLLSPLSRRRVEKSTEALSAHIKIPADKKKVARQRTLGTIAKFSLDTKRRKESRSTDKTPAKKPKAIKDLLLEDFSLEDIGSLDESIWAENEPDYLDDSDEDSPYRTWEWGERFGYSSDFEYDPRIYPFSPTTSEALGRATLPFRTQDRPTPSKAGPDYTTVPRHPHAFGNASRNQGGRDSAV